MYRKLHLCQSFMVPALLTDGAWEAEELLGTTTGISAEGWDTVIARHAI